LLKGYQGEGKPYLLFLINILKRVRARCGAAAINADAEGEKIY
jgi:hypothetical protein